MARRIAWSLIAPALLFHAAADAASVRLGQPVMGTIINVTVEAGDHATAQALAHAAVAQARHWDDVLTTWRPEGQLARFNADAGTGFVSISEDMRRTFSLMQLHSGATHGAFDPAVGPMVDLWRSPTPPARGSLQTPQVTIKSLRLDGRRAALPPGAALDAGGIGKGIALDAILAILRSRRATAAFVDFGGSSQLAFTAPGANLPPWELVVAGYQPGSVHGRLRLANGCVSTSRSSGPGDPAGPIIDPRNGRPVSSPRMATVIAADPTQADAWSTALVVLGRAGLALARKAGVEALVDEAGETEHTENFWRDHLDTDYQNRHTSPQRGPTPR